MTSLGSSVFQFPSVAAWLSSVETPSTSVSGDPFIACTPTPTSRRKKRKLSSKAQLDTPEPINYSSENRAQLLDKRWLYDMTGTLNLQPATPKSSDRTNSTPNAYEIPSTSSAVIPLPDLKLVKTAHTVRQTLAHYGMHIGNSRLQQMYKPFEDDAKAVLNGERGSMMRQESAEHLIRWVSRNKLRAEETIMARMIPLIIPHARKVKKNIGHTVDLVGTDTSPLGESTSYEVKFFEDDGAVANVNRQFNGDLLPIWLEATDHIALRKMLAKETGLTAPKPDYTYGIYEDQYPDICSERFTPNTRAIMGVAPEMVHPFFIIEGKTTKGDLADAENQAIRGGATLVRARRLLNAKAGIGDVVGPDQRSIAYSMTIDTNIARLWLHWCEILPKEPDGQVGGINESETNPSEQPQLYETYHMNSLFTMLLDDEDKLKELRHKVNNIIDWGCVKRMTDIRQVMTKIFEIEKAEKAANLADLNLGNETPNKRQKRGRN